MWMEVTICKLTLPGGLVMGCCACMFIACDLHLECFASSLSQLAVILALMVLNEALDIFRNDDV